MAWTVLEDGSISSPQGYRATGIHAGFKPTRARDLALVYSTESCTAAAMFTTSAIKGAPVLVDQAVLARNRDHIRAVLINSGVANVGTGRPGLEAAVECTRLVSDELEIPRDSVLLMSTGAIGIPLEMDKMRSGIRRAASELDSKGGPRAAMAILHTDRKPKHLALQVSLRDGHTVTLAGMAKGGVHVHPNLATMLCLITSDVSMPAPLLSRSLRQSVAESFHCVTIDGDMSPNDTVLLMANGAASAPPIISASSWEYGMWQEALNHLTKRLALMVVGDSSDEFPLMAVEINGARTDGEARLAALAIARSLGVRRGWQQGVCDWGAIVAALGGSGAELAVERLSLFCGERQIVQDGQLQLQTLAALPDPDQQGIIAMRLELQVGSGTTTIWTPMSGVSAPEQ